jgi:hypothetical protein
MTFGFREAWHGVTLKSLRRGIFHVSDIAQLVTSAFGYSSCVYLDYCAGVDGKTVSAPAFFSLSVHENNGAQTSPVCTPRYPPSGPYPSGRNCESASGIGKASGFSVVF